MKNLIFMILVILYIFSINNQLSGLSFLVLACVGIYVILDLRGDDSELNQKIAAMEERIIIIQARLKSIESEIENE